MPDLKIRLDAVRNHCWQLARFGPDGLERVMQHDDLPAAIAEILESILAVKWPEHTQLTLNLTFTAPEGEKS